MPLHVHCPNGCVIRMSSNRAGRIVRCPKCKSAIRIPLVDEGALAVGEPIACEARIARRRSQDPELDSNGNEAPAVETIRELGEQDLPANEAPSSASGEPPASQSTPGSVLPDERTAPSRLPVPDLVKPVLRLRPILPESLEQEADESVAKEALARLHAKINAPDVIFDDPALAKVEEVTSYRSEIFHDADVDTIVPEPEPEQDLQSEPAANSEVPEVVSKPGSEQNADQDNPHVNARPVTPIQSANVSSEVLTPQFDGEPKLQIPDEALETGEQSLETFKSETQAAGSQLAFDEPAFLKTFAPLSVDQSDAIPVINLNEPMPEAFVAKEEPDWRQRLESANRDRKILARFFAVCLCIVAIVNMAPALYHWYHWTQLAESMPLPRWIYIQVFVGALHLVYAVFLFQVNDWSAMRAVSVAMLVVAFVFGFVSTGLLVGGGQGNLTSFLGIPYMLSRQACIWCVAMLCLATLMSYWGGKESSNWQRTDDLLKDILAKA